MSNYLDQLGLGACLWKIVLLVNSHNKAHFTVGGAIP